MARLCTDCEKGYHPDDCHRTDSDAAFARGYDQGVHEERERIVKVVLGWEPFVGVFNRGDLAAFIRRGDDL